MEFFVEASPKRSRGRPPSSGRRDAWKDESDSEGDAYIPRASKRRSTTADAEAALAAEAANPPSKKRSHKKGQGRGRGRPPAPKAVVDPPMVPKSPPKKRGRAAKAVASVVSPTKTRPEAVPAAKRGRGRPPKGASPKTTAPAKKGRGRKGRPSRASKRKSR